jgi:hypothetical protein
VLNCSKSCNQTKFCHALNIFLEQTLTLNLSLNCKNVPGSTLTRCDWWESKLREVDAMKSSYMMWGFALKITGSNAYNKIKED